MGHDAEAKANTAAAKKSIREIRGEATYMLASILEEDQDHVDYAQVAPLLVGYESNYPMMSAKFQDVVDWRITALDHLGRYDEVNTDVAALVERNQERHRHRISSRDSESSSGRPRRRPRITTIRRRTSRTPS